MSKTEQMESTAQRLAYRNGRSGRCGNLRAVRCVLDADRKQVFHYYLNEEEVSREKFAEVVELLAGPKEI